MKANLTTLGIPATKETVTALKIAIASKVAEFPEKYLTPEGAVICQSITTGVEALTGHNNVKSGAR